MQQIAKIEAAITNCNYSPRVITFTLAVKISSYRVDPPITDRLPMTEHLFIFSSYVLHFE